ncbi:MAG: 4-(cytidine 5'-diphospho)-2-C-methyl-D-erythritol kinase, partial [Mangrovicoccus sp.]
MKVRQSAPAKVNLSLHVTGQDARGYHLLDSLVVFVDLADQVTLSPAAERSLQVTGPMAKGVPEDARNLVWRAAEMFYPDLPVAMQLEKHLPPASGIGGGTSDAAATLRALAELSGRDLPDAAQAAGLGADLPVCLRPGIWRMRGIGEDLSAGPELPPLWLVLVNPRIEVPTPAVFKALLQKTNPPMAPVGQDVIEWIRAQRNDLQAAAESLAPVIGDVITNIGAQPDCRLARMSGS